jgi:hypothetical protein
VQKIIGAGEWIKAEHAFTAAAFLTAVLFSDKVIRDLKFAC